MPDHEVERSADSDEPGISPRPSDRPDDGPDDLQDDDLRQEIELVSDLVLAASASDRPLSLVEIDRILGV